MTEVWPASFSPADNQCDAVKLVEAFAGTVQTPWLQQNAVN